MKFAHVRIANISHLRSKYFTAKRFHLPARANFVAYLLYGRYAVPFSHFLFIKNKAIVLYEDHEPLKIFSKNNSVLENRYLLISVLLVMCLLSVCYAQNVGKQLVTQIYAGKLGARIKVNPV